MGCIYQDLGETPRAKATEETVRHSPGTPLLDLLDGFPPITPGDGWWVLMGRDGS